MAKGRSGTDPGSLRVLWDVGTLAGLDDRALLARFVDRRDEGAELAFEALVRRHGPMVLRVSGQLLDDRHAAEDAFQAVFLVLARRAGSIRSPDRLAPWLHGVALRTAREARSREDKRRRRERRGATMRPTDPKPPEDPLLKVEEAEALHVEIARLPERYRAAVVLCDLEGLTHQEAATRLQCPSGTVAIRLKRARERLRGRLNRRGLDPTAGLMAANLGQGTVPTIPLSLIESTVRASTAAGVASASVLSLAKGVQMSMTFAKWKAATAGAVLALGMASTWGLAGGPQPGPREEAQGIVPEVEVGRAIMREVQDYEEFTGHAEVDRSEEIRSRVGGILEKANVSEGASVKADDILFEIDAKSHQAALKVAEVNVHVAEAQSQLARAVTLRNAALPKKGPKYVSQQEVDRGTADLVDATGKVEAAKTAMVQAQVNLTYTRIKAPFDGRIGRQAGEAIKAGHTALKALPRPIKPGEVVKAGETVLAKIEAFDPMAVDFDIDERTLLRLRRESRDKMVKGDIELPVLVTFVNDRDPPRRGTARFGGESLNPSNGTARLRATISNADHVIIPGMFARVRLITSEPHEALLVPEAAVAMEGSRKYLYVIDARDVVEARPVKVGPLHDDLRVVLEGVKLGERVVVGGLKDVRPGLTVKPRAASAPHP